ncbi:precorrin-3B synthase [Kitasatospora sp. GP30]|nr:precorrin-3B synthase [Kitasatospora sp. GP30]
MLAAMSPSLAAPEPARERAGRGRDDACPGALRLHAADDGALARIRVPGGLLTAEQALALATAAEELGDGALETTSRGNVQLRGLAADAGAELAARLTEAALLPSLSHDRVRNIVATPLAGLDGGTDLRPWLRELDALLCASDTARALSGRFLFALDDGRGDVAALDADVTLIARPDGSALVRLGRADWCAEAVDGPRAALRAAEAFVALADGAWRVREADPDGARLAARLGLTPRPLPELIGRRPVVGVQAGALGAGLRFGRATADQWRALAGAASAAANELRVTPWRTVILPGADLAVLPRLAALGLRTDPRSPWEGATACTGAPGCAKSLADVRADAAAALEATHEPGALPVHWSGCARRCGHPAGAWVDVLAAGPSGYLISQPTGSTTEVTNQQMAAAVAAARRTP